MKGARAGFLAGLCAALFPDAAGDYRRVSRPNALPVKFFHDRVAPVVRQLCAQRIIVKQFLDVTGKVFCITGPEHQPVLAVSHDIP